MYLALRSQPESKGHANVAGDVDSGDWSSLQRPVGDAAQMSALLLIGSYGALV